MLNKNQGPKVDLLDAVNDYEGIAFFQCLDGYPKSRSETASNRLNRPQNRIPSIKGHDQNLEEISQ